jgi:transcriptional regulator with XRE-family HTH domain/uncharacterized membrane protein
MKQPELGAYITTLRNKKGLTQKELAEQCNVDIRTIQRIENGDVVPRMYTINLLSKALDAEIKVSAGAADKIIVDDKYIRQMRFSLIWGVVFLVNYIGVVYNIISPSKSPFEFFRILGVLTNIFCYALFTKGFYHLGRKYDNPILAISILFSMVLIAFSNLLYLAPDLLTYHLTMKELWIVSAIFSLPVYVLLCMCAIVTGIGMFIQRNKVSGTQQFSLYKTTGIVGIVQSIMLLAIGIRIQVAGHIIVIQYIGLIISIFSNVLMLIILYKEHSGNLKPTEKIKVGLLLS